MAERGRETERVPCFSVLVKIWTSGTLICWSSITSFYDSFIVVSKTNTESNTSWVARSQNNIYKSALSCCKPQTGVWYLTVSFIDCLQVQFCFCWHLLVQRFSVWAKTWKWRENLFRSEWAWATLNFASKTFYSSVLKLENTTFYTVKLKHPKEVTRSSVQAKNCFAWRCWSHQTTLSHQPGENDLLSSPLFSLRITRTTTHTLMPTHSHSHNAASITAMTRHIVWAACLRLKTRSALESGSFFVCSRLLFIEQ